MNKKSERYLLNINTGKIHDTDKPCCHAARMKEESKKWFDKFEDAENFYEGKKNGVPCGVCMKDYSR